MSQKLIENLKYHGFTEYEAKTYAAIAGLGMGTAREINEISGVPQGRIYTVLNTLAERGFVEIQEGSPTFYLVEDPAEMFTEIKEDYCTKVDEMIDELKHLHYEAKPSLPFWSIHSEKGIWSRQKMLIRNAEREIIIFVKEPQGIRHLLKDLKTANKRLNLTILTFDRTRFSNLGLRIDNMSSELLNLFKEMDECGPGMKDVNWSTESSMLIDGTNALTVGYKSGKKSATVIKMPPVCFMIRKLIIMLEPEIKW